VSELKNVATVRDDRWAVVNTLMNLRNAVKGEEFLDQMSIH